MPHARTKPASQQRTYGVLFGTIRDGREDPAGHSSRYEIWVEADQNYRIAVNVRSVDGSDVLAHYDPNFTNPTKLGLAGLAAGAMGFTGLTTGPGGKGLDYLRDGLFPSDAMAPIPPDGQGVTLQNLLDGQVERAKADRSAVVIALGEFFEDRGRDETFGFSPELGVHDIHMMQGDVGSFADDNRINGEWRAVHPLRRRRGRRSVRPLQRAVDHDRRPREPEIASVRRNLWSADLVS